MFPQIFALACLIYAVASDRHAHSGRRKHWHEHENNSYVDLLHYISSRNQKLDMAPPYKHDLTVEVTFGIHLLSLQKMTWNDWRLRWDPAEFGDISYMSIPLANHIWTPDIYLYNDAKPNGDGRVYDELVPGHITHDGEIAWIIPTTIKVQFAANISTPTKQIITMKYGSWTHNAFQISLKLKELDTSEYIKNNCWQLTETSTIKNTIKYSCCPEPYDSIVVSLNFDMEDDAPQFCKTLH